MPQLYNPVLRMYVFSILALIRALTPILALIRALTPILALMGGPSVLSILVDVG